MDDLLPVLSRWVHVGSAIVVLGGSVFMRFVLMPAAAELPDDTHNALREQVVGRWRKFIGTGILLFLISGFYNYYLAIPTSRVEESRLYHPLMGVKILLSLAVFFLASALTGRSKALQGIRQNAKRWLTVTVVLAVLVVAIAGFLKVAVK